MSATEATETAFGTRASKKGMFRTVSQMYKEQLTKLMTTLKNTKPNFVRCIIPNHEKKVRRALAIGSSTSQACCRPEKSTRRLCSSSCDATACSKAFEFVAKAFRIEFRSTSFATATRCLPPAPCRAVLWTEKRAQSECAFLRVRRRAACRLVGVRRAAKTSISCRKILDALDIESESYRIGLSKVRSCERRLLSDSPALQVFFRAGILAKLEEARDVAVTALVIGFQARCRSFLACRAYSKRQHQHTAIIVVQRNCAAWLKLRNWDWWRLFTKVKPLLQITNQEAALAARDDEIRTTRERLQRVEVEAREHESAVSTLADERDRLSTQLAREVEERAELDDERERLAAKNSELDTLVATLQARLDDEETRFTTSSVSLKDNQVRRGKANWTSRAHTRLTGKSPRSFRAA